MGYKDKRSPKGIKEQFWHELQKMEAFGESKKVAKEEGTTEKKIYAFKSMQTYKQQLSRYADWLKECYPETKKLKDAKIHVPEYLRGLCSETSSAATICTARSALNKLFQIKPGDEEFFKAPARKRDNIIRSRNTATRDKHFSEKKNWDVVSFCQCVGMRRSEVQKSKGEHYVDRATLIQQVSHPDTTPTERGIIKDALAFPDVEHFMYAKGKGGRERFIPIIGPYEADVVSMLKSTPENKKIWGKVNSSADIHSYRAEYAMEVYRRYARKIEDIPYDAVTKNGKRYQSDVYTCRGDMKGLKLDRKAMRLVSKALGHNREEVFAISYLRPCLLG